MLLVKDIMPMMEKGGPARAETWLIKPKKNNKDEEILTSKQRRLLDIQNRPDLVDMLTADLERVGIEQEAELSSRNVRMWMERLYSDAGVSSPPPPRPDIHGFEP